MVRWKRAARFRLPCTRRRRRRAHKKYIDEGIIKLLLLRCIDTIGRIFVPKRWKVLVWHIEVEFQVKEKSPSFIKTWMVKSDWYCHRKWALLRVHVVDQFPESRLVVRVVQQTWSKFYLNDDRVQKWKRGSKTVKEFYPHVWLSLIRHVAHHSFDTPDMTRSSGSTDTRKRNLSGSCRLDR